MRIAIAGKGGAGKTTFSATTARLLAREGMNVVAIDADTNPNLAAAMGFDLEAVSNVPILPTNIVSRRLDGSSALRVPLDAVLGAHAVRGPDGVRLVRMACPTTHKKAVSAPRMRPVLPSLLSSVHSPKPGPSWTLKPHRNI